MGSSQAKAGLSPFQIALFLVIVGISAALHVWKLAPALPALQNELQLSLVESGFLLSSVQIGGMSLGLMIGLFAERIGLKRCIVIGLSILVLGSVASTLTHHKTVVLLCRALEGCGFLMVVLPVPALIKRLVAPQQLSQVMGLWGCYMPMGAVITLWAGSWFLTVGSWRLLWLILGGLSLLFMVLAWRILPRDARTVSTQRTQDHALLHMVSLTLRTKKVWLVAVVFCVYAAQWAGVIGFLPTFYIAGNISGALAGFLTGMVAGANILGNLGAGRLIQKKIAPHHLLFFGFTTMMVCAVLAFGLNIGLLWQFLAILTFSAVGGLIPATCFYLAVNYAPSPQTTSSTVGWVQQLSSLGQFFGPPAVALAVNALGGWHWAWTATVSFAVVGLVLAWLLSRR
ncbi:TetR family transcriptional regulator [Paenalcaligenes hominis]|uniref:TetR family transcriptional regulator n=1 Tax=Paenalcaligenes hominis TaxID=643674 RepID=A0A1U9JYS0_9BURK|nr:MFS transporter [Paenalcaligenes hominis]AQS50917.1 TetR family transcriptional regulator [Paenalcaligenes hominis]